MHRRSGAVVMTTTPRVEHAAASRPVQSGTGRRRLKVLGSAWGCVKSLPGMRSVQAKPRRAFRLLLPIAVLCVALGAAIRRPAASAVTSEPAVMAVVDGVAIPSKLYQTYLRNGIAVMGPESSRDAAQVDRLKSGIVAELIDRQLVEAEVRQRGLDVDEARVWRDYSNSVLQMGGPARFNEHLREQGLSDEEYRHIIVQEICGQLMRDELGKEVAVSNDEIRAFYDQNKDDAALARLFEEPERVRASHILISARPGQIAAELETRRKGRAPGAATSVRQEMDRRRVLAAGILAQLKRGASFASLATAYSDDAATRGAGGDLGRFTKNTHTTRFDDRAFSLGVGQVSGIVETEFGFHIIKATEHVKEHRRTLEEATADIRALLLGRKQAAHLNQWLAARRRAADIRIDPFFAGQSLQGLGNFDH